MLTLLLTALGALDLPMPPPPPGMRLVAQAPTLDAGVTPAPAPARESATPPTSPAPTAGATATGAGGAPRGQDDTEADAELEEMRALEDAAIEPAAASDASLRVLLSRLGYGTLLRDRLEGALEDAEGFGDELPFELAPVGDVAAFDVTLVRDRYDIPVEMQPLVAQYIHFFQGRGRKYFVRWMNRSHRYIPLMQPLLEEKGLPRDLVYLAMIESGFSTQARSWARAVGPWQFIAGTAKLYGLKEDFWVDERRDPIKATNAAARYLSELHQNLGHWYLAWAGYNTGGRRVRRLMDTYGTNDFWVIAAQKRGLARETKHYVPKLIACALVARHPEAFGFSPDEFQPEDPFEYDEVKLVDPVDLEVLATAAGTTVAALRDLNPEVKRWCTPPASEQAPYVFRIPKGHAAEFAANFAKYAPSERLHFKIHRVQKGDTLSKITAQYHSAQEAIMRMNGLTSVRSLRVGTDLVVPVPSAQALKAGRSDTALERQVVRARRSGLAAVRPEEEIPAGVQAATSRTTVGGSVTTETIGGKTRVIYGVARGDSLWAIARRFDVRVADLREWNEALAGSRSLKVGTSLVVWPGANANLSGASAGKAKAKP